MTDSPKTTSARSQLHRWSIWLDRLGPLAGLVVILGLSLFNPQLREHFFNPGTAQILFAQTTVVALCALGMTAIIVSGGIDLSVGAVVALTCVMTSLALEANWHPALAIATGILGGGVIGALNGIIITRFSLMPFIVTLGMMGIARGVSKRLADNQTVNFDLDLHEWVTVVMSPIPPPDMPIFFAPGIWLTFGLAVFMGILLALTPFGRQVYAIGSNESTARLCGVPVEWRKFQVYTLAGLLFGLAGVLQMCVISQGDPTIQVGLELDVIAAVVLGGASLSGGVGGIAGSLIGALTIQVLKVTTMQLNWPTYFQEIIIGVVIILAIGLDQFRKYLRS